MRELVRSEIFLPRQYVTPTRNRRSGGQVAQQWFARLPDRSLFAASFNRSASAFAIADSAPITKARSLPLFSEFVPGSVAMNFSTAHRPAAGARSRLHFPDEVLNAATPARQAVAPERFIDWLNHPAGT